MSENKMNKICGYRCEHNKGGVCQTTMCDKKIVMTTTTNEPFEKRFNVKYDEQGVEKFTRWLDPTIEEYKKEIDRLNNIINEARDKLYCWGEILDAEFQQSMLAILNKGGNNE